MKKKILIAVFIGVFSLGAIFTASEVQAFAGRGQNQNMISALAKKLGLSEDKVKKAFDGIQADRQKEMQAAFEKKLTQAVKDGKITESQKQLILTKHNELKKEQLANRENGQNKRAELEKWASDNGIPTEFFGMGRGMKGGMGRARGWMK